MSLPSVRFYLVYFGVILLCIQVHNFYIFLVNFSFCFWTMSLYISLMFFWYKWLFLYQCCSISFLLLAFVEYFSFYPYVLVLKAIILHGFALELSLPSKINLISLFLDSSNNSYLWMGSLLFSLHLFCLQLYSYLLSSFRFSIIILLFCSFRPTPISCFLLYS